MGTMSPIHQDAVSHNSLVSCDIFTPTVFLFNAILCLVWIVLFLVGVSAYDGEMTAVSDFRKGGIPVGVNF